MKGNVTNTGYWPDSPDRNNDFNIIPSNEITMEGMDMPLMGISNKGDKKLMLPGKNYKFKGETVMETPLDKGIFLGAYKQVGGQLVPHDADMGSFQKGGQPIHVYSKDDPAYKKYLQQKAYYDQQKALYETRGRDLIRANAPENKTASLYQLSDDIAMDRAKREAAYNRAAGLSYDALTNELLKEYERKYKSQPWYKSANHDSLDYLHVNDDTSAFYAVRKPTPVILEKEVKPKAIDIKPLPTPPPVVELKPVLQNIQHPQTNKQRVIINTPQGDKIRVQDAKTKRFINWEDDKGLPSDIENPSGTASQDFPQMRRVMVPPGGFAYGGDISVPNLSRQEGGSSYDIPAQSYRDPNVVREEGREWYDPASETIHMQPSYPNVIHEQMVKGHELDHHKQKLKGKLSSTEYWPGPLKEPALGASDEMTYSYYNRAGQDIRNLMNAAPQSTFFGIPEDVAVTGFQNKTYDTPGTAEYEAEHPDTPRTVYRGKPVVKNAIAKTLNREEKDPEMMFKNKYNTELTKEEQKDFDKWAEEESKKQGRDVLMDKGAYDVQGFWKSGDWKNRDADNHGTDTWKKPNHPTFSNQSKYNGAGGWYGGNWTEDAGYQPSKQTLNNYGPDYYNWMFGEEPNRPEYLDMSRYDGKNSATPIVYKEGGSVKKVKIKSLPKNWKTQ